MWFTDIDTEKVGEEIKILSFPFGETRMDRIRNENIRGTVQVRCID